MGAHAIAMPFLDRSSWISAQHEHLSSLWAKVRGYSCIPSFEEFCDIAYDLSSKNVIEYGSGE